MSSIKDRAIAATAAELRVSTVTVRMVVSTYDRNRAALKRVSSGSKVQPKAVGGGWYLLPDGTKIQGRDAAVEAMSKMGNVADE